MLLQESGYGDGYSNKRKPLVHDISMYQSKDVGEINENRLLSWVNTKLLSNHKQLMINKYSTGKVWSRYR